MCFGWWKQDKAGTAHERLEAAPAAPVGGTRGTGLPAGVGPSPEPDPSPEPEDPTDPKGTPSRAAETKKPKGKREVPTMRVHRDTVATMEPGPHSVGFDVMSSPRVWPGHGFLLLPGIVADRLEVDGLEVAGSSPGPLTAGAGPDRLVGFYNVPSGDHTLVASRDSQRCELGFGVPENGAVVATVDAGAGRAAVGDDPDLVRAARKGVLVEEGRISPWPFASLFLRDLPGRDDVTLDGAPVHVGTSFVGLQNLLPGPHRFTVGPHTVELVLGRAEAQVWSSADGAPVAMPGGRTMDSLIRAHLMTTQDPVLLRADRLPR